MPISLFVRGRLGAARVRTSSLDCRAGADLCNSCRPEHYDLTIKTDLQKLHFSGTSVIHLNLASAQESITLNIALPLKLKNAVLSHTSLKTESVRPATKMVLDEKRERVTLSFAGGEVQQGSVKLALRWEGKLEGSMMG